MATFLEQTVELILREHDPIQEHVFVLPTVRSSHVFKRELAKRFDHPIFSPTIVSVESFISDLAKGQAAERTELVFLLYEAYKRTFVKPDTFDVFLTWANTFIQDVEDMDSSLIDADKLFEYLTQSNRINEWSKQGELTPLISKGVKFWSALNPLKKEFDKAQAKIGKYHSGQLYRRAFENSKGFLDQTSKNHFHFIGFNALNKAQEGIVDLLIKKGKATLYWDVDPVFFEGAGHEVAYFLKSYQNKWPSERIRLIYDPVHRFYSEKNLEIIGTPKNVGQAKLTGNLLHGIPEENIDGTVVYLPDENLLTTLLNSLPNNGSTYNITMGLPIDKGNLTLFFNSIFDCLAKRRNDKWPTKELRILLNNPILEILEGDDQLRNLVKTRNSLLQSSSYWTSGLEIESYRLLELDSIGEIFKDPTLTIKPLLVFCQNLLLKIKKRSSPQNRILYGQCILIDEVFVLISGQITRQIDLDLDLLSFQKLFTTAVAEKKLHLKGDANKGIQIMGLLEGRALDFDTVIMPSLNEGILPAGKTNNSFIPYDIKREFGLPTHKEKNAVYAYHFYRSIQRSKNIHLIYNTEVDVLLGGERSRYIEQLLTDRKINSSISHKIISSEVELKLQDLRSVVKNERLIGLLLAKATGKGFSPSSLSTYIRDPFLFYKRYVMGIKEPVEWQASIQANVFGTIVHDALEELYQPLIGKSLTKTNLKPLLGEIDSAVAKGMGNVFSNKSTDRGQMLLIKHVVRAYLKKMLAFDIQRVGSQEIKLLELERELAIEIDVPGITKVKINGKADRIESVNGVVHIIDYKTGKTEPSNVQVVDIMDSITNRDKAKAFQLLCYVLMYEPFLKGGTFKASVFSILDVSGKNLAFATMPSVRSRTKDYLIDQEKLSGFKRGLTILLTEIFNPANPFQESEPA